MHGREVTPEEPWNAKPATPPFVASTLSFNRVSLARYRNKYFSEKPLLRTPLTKV